VLCEALAQLLIVPKTYVNRTEFTWKSLQAVPICTPSLILSHRQNLWCGLSCVTNREFLSTWFRQASAQDCHLNLDFPVDVSTCELCLNSNDWQWKSGRYCQWSLKMDTQCLVNWLQWTKLHKITKSLLSVMGA